MARGQVDCISEQLEEHQNLLPFPYREGSTPKVFLSAAPSAGEHADYGDNKIKVLKRQAYAFHDERYFALKIIQAFDPT